MGFKSGSAGMTNGAELPSSLNSSTETEESLNALKSELPDSEFEGLTVAEGNILRRFTDLTQEIAEKDQPFLELALEKFKKNNPFAQLETEEEFDQARANALADSNKRRENVVASTNQQLSNSQEVLS